MDKWKWLIFAGLGVLTIALLVITKPQTAKFEGDPAKIVADDRVYGNADAKVVFIEYADFQCPGCGALFSPLTQAKELYKDKVAFVFRHLPLTSIHPNAKAAAAAAEAAGQQGKFWEMHDLLFGNQSEWSEVSADARGSFFEKYAKQLSLDIPKFQTAVASKEVADRINRDLGAAQKAGIQLSTPTVVINGKTIDNSSMSEEINGQNIFTAAKISSLLDAKLKEVGETPPTPDPAAQPAQPTGEASQ
ncbi:thioredoxin domain-containing protein [Candidatus Saccharibacteria bacterium]|nr:thioredoxin domain-containing protein [Candidatus Saccharibacteria bacterium]